VASMVVTFLGSFSESVLLTVVPTQSLAAHISCPPALKGRPWIQWPFPPTAGAVLYRMQAVSFSAANYLQASGSWFNVASFLGTHFHAESIFCFRVRGPRLDFLI